MKAVDSPAVRAALSHLRDAEFAGWTVDDEVDGPLLLIETRKIPTLRLEPAILDFIGYWLSKDRSAWPKGARGWRQAVRNWMNNAVRFASWYAVAPLTETATRRHGDTETRSTESPRPLAPWEKGRTPTGRITASPCRPPAEPVACGEIVKSEMAKIRQRLEGGT